jgi:hypothetical protein
MVSKADKCDICRHIFISGRRCQSPALTGSVFCYFHRTLRRGHTAVSTTKVGPLRPETAQYLLQNGQDLAQFAPYPALNFPPLEDVQSIQLAASLVFAAIAARQVDPIQARNLLYALQVASCNLRALPSGAAPGGDVTTLAHRVVRTRYGQTLAARGSGNGIHCEAPGRESRFAEMLNNLLYPNGTPPAAAPANPSEGDAIRNTNK